MSMLGISWTGDTNGVRDGTSKTCWTELKSYIEEEKRGVSSKKVTLADI